MVTVLRESVFLYQYASDALETALIVCSHTVITIEVEESEGLVTVTRDDAMISTQP